MSLPHAALTSLIGGATIFSSSDLVITPNDQVVFQIREQILSQKEVLLNVKICSFGFLEKTLAKEYWPELIDSLERTFFLNHLALKLRPVLDLPGSPTLSETFDLAERLADGLDRLRLARLSWETIASLTPENLAKALATLGQEYETFLGERIDQFGRRVLILNALSEGREFKYLQKIKTIHCYHAQRLSPFETALLKALAQSGRTVNITLDTPNWLLEAEDRDINRAFKRLQIYRDLEDPDQSLVGLNLLTVDPEAPNYPSVPEVLRKAAAQIFGPPFEGEVPEVNGAITILAAPNQYQEVEAIGRRLKRAIVEEGVRPSHLGAVVPRIDEWLPAFIDVGRRFGLEFHYRRGESLSDTGPVLAIMDLLALWSSHWELKRVLNILSSPYFDFKLSGIPLETLYAAGVSDDRLGGGFELNVQKANKQKDNALEPLLEAVKILREAGSSLKRIHSWPIFIATFMSLLERLNWPNLKENDPNEPGAEISQKVRKEYAERLTQEPWARDEFNKVINNFCLAVANSPYAPEPSLATFNFWLKKLINDIDRSSNSSTSDGIWLLNYYDLQGLTFEKLYLMGLNDSSFPVARAENRWWPDEFLKSLAKTSLGRNLWSDSFETYQGGEEILAAALGQAQEVVLSYSETSTEKNAKPLLPSPFIESLKAMFPDKTYCYDKAQYPDKDSCPIKDTCSDRDFCPVKAIPVVKAGSLEEVNELSDYRELLVYLAAMGVSDLTNEQVALIPEKDPQSLWASLKARRQPLEPFVFSPEFSERFIKAQIMGPKGPVLDLAALSDYISCPFKFYLVHILNISVPTEVIDGWSSFARSALCRQALTDFFRPLTQEGARLDVSWSRLEGIFDDKANYLAKITPLGREPLYQRGKENLKESLKGWRNRKDAADFQRGEVLALNFTFDQLDNADAPPVALGRGKASFHLRGRVNRVEKLKDELIVREYVIHRSDRYENTSDKLDPEAKKLSTPGTHYRILLGALAIREKYKKDPQAIIEFIEPLERDEILILDTPLDSFKELLEEAYEALLRGKPVTEDADCDSCHYRSICPEARNKE
ncbi:MAG: PD-(D/E)XK nuclease family protein [Deltaproteobacteria bacterium]|jgi:hypothetical protein|nr:PD-(D/E)XK nuclease family protein [Deltaproteobacteria bacterium]